MYVALAPPSSHCLPDQDSPVPISQQRQDFQCGADVTRGNANPVCDTTSPGPTFFRQTRKWDRTLRLIRFYERGVKLSGGIDADALIR